MIIFLSLLITFNNSDSFGMDWSLHEIVSSLKPNHYCQAKLVQIIDTQGRLRIRSRPDHIVPFSSGKCQRTPDGWSKTRDREPWWGQVSALFRIQVAEGPPQAALHQAPQLPTQTGSDIIRWRKQQCSGFYIMKMKEGDWGFGSRQKYQLLPRAGVHNSSGPKKNCHIQEPKSITSYPLKGCFFKQIG